MYVRWKKKPIRWARRELECWHYDAGRQLLTPLVVESHRTERGPRQKTVLRLPSIRSCCVSDPIVRTQWWAEVNIRLMRALDEEQQFFVRWDLTDTVPPPSDADRLLASLWAKSGNARPATSAERTARLEALRREVDRLLRAGEDLWARAVQAWQVAESKARARVDLAFMNDAKCAQDLAAAAIAAARSAGRPRQAAAELWQKHLDAWSSQTRLWEERARRATAHATAKTQRVDDCQDPIARAHRASRFEMIAFFGLPPHFNADDLHRARRRELAKHHPDRADGSAAMATAVNIMADRLRHLLQPARGAT